jgi:hypothetical protein
MKQLPPPMLVKTWLYIIYTSEEDMDSQKFKLRKLIKELFGTIELAQLYIEQISDEDFEIYLV